MKNLKQISLTIAAALLVGAGVMFFVHDATAGAEENPVIFSTYWVEPFDNEHYLKVDSPSPGCEQGTEIVCKISTSATPDPMTNLVPIDGSIPLSYRDTE